MDFIRQKVAGKRVRLKEDKYNLDLTYITPRIVAMSYPAEKLLQKIYRNDITTVSSYLKEKHQDNYWVYNLSGIGYDATPFNNKVSVYDWKDHHSPALVLLAELCQHMNDFLDQKDENTLVIHCNAGKGRTGVIISCYMLWCGFASTAQEAITYYGWKRFQNGLGVTQPSQLRYIFYFEKVLQGKINSHKRVQLDRIYIQNLPSFKQVYRIQARIKSAKDYELIHKNPEEEMIENPCGSSIYIDFEEEDIYLENDIFISLMHLSKKKIGKHDKEICRFGFNTSFLNPKDDPGIRHIHRQHSVKYKEKELKNDLIKRSSSNISSEDGGPPLTDFQIKLDRFLIDPNSCSADKTYQDPDIKLILAFSEVEDDSDLANPDALMEWQKINTIIQQRNIEFQVKDGKTDRKLGIKHMFGPGKEADDDYGEYIAKENDPRIYGRYKDIENLGHDIQVEENTVFRKSTVSKERSSSKRKMTIKQRLQTIKILDTIQEEEIKEEEKKEHEVDSPTLEQAQGEDKLENLDIIKVQESKDVEEQKQPEVELQIGESREQSDTLLKPKMEEIKIKEEEQKEGAADEEQPPLKPSNSSVKSVLQPEDFSKLLPQGDGLTLDQINEHILQNIKQHTLADRAFGSILGAMIADSCGSLVENEQFMLTEEALQECLSMPGGGPHKVAPGQVTDDSEMMLCQLQGIVQGIQENPTKNATENVLSIPHISEMYKQWFDSSPFALKETIRIVFNTITCGVSTKIASTVMAHSQSNSSLMRIMPMVVWASSLKNPKDVCDALIADTDLTHANRLVKSATFIYGMALYYLVNQPTDKNRGKKAFDLAFQLCETAEGNYEDPDTNETCKQWLYMSEELANIVSAEENVDIDWEAKQIDELVKCRESCGWIQRAFVLAFYFLLKYSLLPPSNTFYQDSIKLTIKQGGDTDTNACIVGGLVGALVGVNNLPQDMLNKLLAYDCTSDGGVKRPEFLSVKRQALPNIVKLLQLRPKEKLIMKE